MKKLFSFLALCLSLCIVSCYDDAALWEHIKALETNQIATINEQIDAIKSSITDLEATDKEVDAAIAAIIKEDAERDERIQSLNDSIAELQATDEAIQAEIAAMTQTLQSLAAQDGEFKEQIAELESAIAELRAVDATLQAEIAAIKETLQALAERDERFQADVDSLKAKDAALEVRIEELKAYVDAELASTKDWAKATFSTLEQYQATCDELAAIKVLIAEQEASLKQALTDAITASETSMKEWVNEQLRGYWTIAETQAKLDTIKANTDQEVAAIKADLKTAKEELTAAYQSEIAKAIADSEGKLSAKIDEINSALDKRIGAIEARLDAIEEKLKVLDTLTRDFAIVFDDTEIGIVPGGTSSVGYTITGATETTTVKALGQGGWIATVTPDGTDKGTIIVTAPDPITEQEIIVLAYDGEYRTVMSTLNFAKGYATPSQAAVEFGAEADTISITLTANLGYNVSIPVEAQSWLSVVEPNATRAVTTESISFACKECVSGFRQTTVRIEDQSKTLISIISFVQRGKSIEVTLNTAGTLHEALGSILPKDVEGIIINGPINGTDILTIKKMINIQFLDMYNARIVSGGDPYYLYQNSSYGGVYTEDNVIGGSMFENCEAFNNKDCKIVLPSSVVKIGGDAFYTCKGLVSVTLPDSLREIGASAFEKTSISNISLPEGLEIIDGSAFQACCLSEITIPSTVKMILSNAFAYNNIVDIHIKALPGTLTKMYLNIFDYDTYNEATLYIPKGTYDYYSTLGDFYRFKNIIEVEE